MTRLGATICCILFGATLAFAQLPSKSGSNPYFIKKPQVKTPKKGAKEKANDIPPALRPYLTKEGHLRSPLEVRDEKRGFGIFFGTHWRIEPDGRWSSTRILRNQPRRRGAGKLSKKDLVLLAAALASAKVETLSNVGRPLVNPHVQSISYGGRKATIILGVDRKLVPVNPLQPQSNPAGRFSTIFTAVKGAIEPHIGPEPLPRRLR